MPAEPTVFIIDDDAAVRRVLRGLVASVDLRVEAFASAQDFLRACDPDQPGCLVLDIRMPDMSGLELQKELKARGIDLPVIIITGHGDVQVAVHALKGGAIDFIEKPFNNQLLLDRVQSAVAESVRRTDDRVKRADIKRRLTRLTPRERQVLNMVASGETNKSVARCLDISERTVEHHRARVMEKLRAKSLADLVKMAAILSGD